MITLWIILYTVVLDAPPSMLEYNAYPTRDACEHEVVRMRRLAMSFNLSPIEAWCQKVILQQ
jgi:hypothetical protein